ncbi:DUF4232 domain-containing protein [Prauserella rugosa]|uniref:Uncharacterized protein DUF4232 n=1 Tax=Prauserella rugosa TaxID=43354 RepID=A0A660CE79_9PSEU|nr:DUF4232 domain-containing protein [Prauserella rugosa]KMS92012.1 hypothetical protein ACZ91_06635 [Streptomyces regensis]TWH21888.1 uncharacterized protein DUF4232 [Prauserella rugosa]
MNKIGETASRTSIAVAGTAILAMILTGCGDASSGAAQNDPDADPATTSAPSQQSGQQSEQSESGNAPGKGDGAGDAPKQAVPAPQQSEGGSGSGSGGAGKTDLCRAADLELSLGRGEGTAGTQYRPLRFTNVSDSACVLHGFPGVSYVAGDDGHQVGPAAYRTGGKGEPVTVQPGQVAHAPVGFVRVQNYDPADCKPTPVRGLRVYPPQETNSMFVPAEGTGCAANPEGQQLTVATIQPGR